MCAVKAARSSWLASVAAKASQISKEEHFLGTGGTLVSRDEREAISQLANVLGVNAGPAGAR